MNLNTIIEKKKKEFSKLTGFRDFINCGELKSFHAFLEKAIRESVEEALREVKPEKADGQHLLSEEIDRELFESGYNAARSKMDYLVKEFMK